MNKKQKEVQQVFLDSEKEVLKKLKKNYQDALDEINTKIEILLARQDADMQHVIYQVEYQKALKTQVQGILDTLQANEFETVSEYLAKSYEDGFIGTVYDMQGQGIPLIMPIDQEQVAKAIQHETKLSESLYNSLGKDIKVLNKQIAGEISRGISTGMMFSEISRNIAGYAGISRNKAMRIARTEGHRIQCKATMDAQFKAKEKGADVVKQWDASLDGKTRPTHRKLDGQIRELDEEFEVSGYKAMMPGGFNKASEDINCRCALLQRARWALGESELETLKQRAEYFGLDKTDSFEEYKEKYLKASQVVEELPKPKKEYLTEKKLKQKIEEAEKDIQALFDKYGDDITKFGMNVPTEDTLNYIVLMENKADWEEKLNKKLAAKEIKKLKKDIIASEEALDAFEIKTYSGIWKDDVTTADWNAKKGSIAAKKDYFEQKLKYSTNTDEIEKWSNLLKDLDDFNTKGEEYYKLSQALKQQQSRLKNIQKNGIINQLDDKFSQERKDNAHWFTNQNGSVKGADKVLRSVSGDVWKNASELEKDSIYEYTQSYHKFNEPLRGIEYGTNKFLGVGNVNLDEIGVNYGGFKRGEVKKQIDAITSIIDKSTYTEDIWVQRGCGYGGMDKFFGIDPDDFYLPEDELANKLLNTTPTEYGFMSTGVSKGKGFANKPIILNIYAPAGTKMMYVEPFSAFGNGAGRKWDGVSGQSSFGDEAEMLIQRETTFKVTKVEKSSGKIYIDLEIRGQGES